MNSTQELQEEAKIIRDVRDALGWSRDRMAAHLGCSASTLKGAENATHRLGARRFMAVRELAVKLPARPGVEPAGDGGIEVADSFTGYGSARQEQRRTRRPTTLREVVRLSKDPEIQQAGKALAKVAGLSEEDAVAEVIRLVMASRP